MEKREEGPGKKCCHFFTKMGKKQTTTDGEVFVTRSYESVVRVGEQCHLTNLGDQGDFKISVNLQKLLINGYILGL